MFFWILVVFILVLQLQMLLIAEQNNDIKQRSGKDKETTRVINNLNSRQKSLCVVVQLMHLFVIKH
jgi:hypothetical protein